MERVSVQAERGLPERPGYDLRLDQERADEEGVCMKVLKSLYKHKGKVYKPEIIEDLKRDTYRVIHWVEDPETGTFQADYTPHHAMSKRDFEMYVDMGCPVQRGEHPWSHYRLYEAYKKNPEGTSTEINKALKPKTEKKSAPRKTRNT